MYSVCLCSHPLEHEKYLIQSHQDVSSQRTSNKFLVTKLRRSFLIRKLRTSYDTSKHENKHSHEHSNFAVKGI